MPRADLVRRYIDCYNSRDASGLGAFYAEDVILEDPMSPGPTRGRESVVATAAAFRRAFPDMRWTLTREPVVADAAIAWEARATGRMTGPTPGPDGDIPPTGKAFALDMAVCWALGSDGLIAEERAYFDATGLMVQLGLKG
jgi:steroid delta-isomerase-like uncharacterized protein